MEATTFSDLPASSSYVSQSVTTFIPLRKGKWSKQEEEYCNSLIQGFVGFSLPIPIGSTLRFYLSYILHCEPMRISKKYAKDTAIGKQVYKTPLPSPSHSPHPSSSSYTISSSSSPSASTILRNLDSQRLIFVQKLESGPGLLNNNNIQWRDVLPSPSTPLHVHPKPPPTTPPPPPPTTIVLSVLHHPHIISTSSSSPHESLKNKPRKMERKKRNRGDMNDMDVERVYIRETMGKRGRVVRRRGDLDEENEEKMRMNKRSRRSEDDDNIMEEVLFGCNDDDNIELNLERRGRLPWSNQDIHGKDDNNKRGSDDKGTSSHEYCPKNHLHHPPSSRTRSTSSSSSSSSLLVSSGNGMKMRRSDGGVQGLLSMSSSNNIDPSSESVISPSSLYCSCDDPTSSSNICDIKPTNSVLLLKSILKEDEENEMKKKMNLDRNLVIRGEESDSDGGNLDDIVPFSSSSPCPSSFPSLSHLPIIVNDENENDVTTSSPQDFSSSSSIISLPHLSTSGSNLVEGDDNVEMDKEGQVTGGEKEEEGVKGKSEGLLLLAELMEMEEGIIEI